MKTSKNHFGNAGQSISEVKKSHKHDANLQKNSSLYFQIGLILCLLGTYALFEMQFQKEKITVTKETDLVEKITVDYVPPFEVEKVKVKKPEQKRSEDLKDLIDPIEDDIPLKESILDVPINTTPKVDAPTKVGDIKTIEEPDDPLIIDFINVQKVPVFPGCEKYNTNNERKKCLNDKVRSLVGRKFNVNIGNTYGIKGKQRIFTQFTIDKYGNVTNVKIRGPHPAVEKEAKRVLNQIPTMEPGIQGDSPVGVIYNLPIIYEVRN